MNGSRNIRRRLRAERGQTLILGLMAVIILIVGILVLFDVQRVIRGKVKVMSAIDSAALTGAKWQQNTLNLIGEMNLNPGQMGLIINRAPKGELDAGIREEIEKHGLKLFGVLPHDDAVYRCDCDGQPSAYLPESDPMKAALGDILRKIGL